MDRVLLHDSLGGKFYAKKILVVDHHSVESSTVSEILRLQGYHVEEVEGEKALSSFAMKNTPLSFRIS